MPLVETPKVKVQLTRYGIGLANGGPLSISDGQSQLTFRAGEAVPISVFEWPWLRDHVINGEAIFELAPGEKLPAPPKPRPPAGTPVAAPAHAADAAQTPPTTVTPESVPAAAAEAAAAAAAAAAATASTGSAAEPATASANASPSDPKENAS